MNPSESDDCYILPQPAAAPSTTPLENSPAESSEGNLTSSPTTLDSTSSSSSRGSSSSMETEPSKSEAEMPATIPGSAPTPPIYPCPVCVHVFFATITDMKSHLEAQHRKFQCDVCRKLMSHKRNVDRHRKSVHENQRGFGCPMCPYRSAHKQVIMSAKCSLNNLQTQQLL